MALFPACRRKKRWSGGRYREFSGIEAIGVDEVQERNGHTSLTVVHQRDTVQRLLPVAEDPTERSLRGLAGSLTAEVRPGVQFVASERWKPYLKAIAQQIPSAIHMLTRFHIMGNMNVAIDEVRRAEAAKMRTDDSELILTNARWSLRRTSPRTRRSG